MAAVVPHAERSQAGHLSERGSNVKGMQQGERGGNGRGAVGALASWPFTKSACITAWLAWISSRRVTPTPPPAPLGKRLGGSGRTALRSIADRSSGALRCL